jgi:FlaA1/EpsC-like NDP-sugar epimerase
MGSRGSVVPFFLSKAKEGVLPITDKRMTRFNILLEEGVDMVLWAIENAIGGEIFVPKIPSYNIETLARAIAPSCRLEDIGIRPGEKLHEEMITSSDSYNTIDIGKYYAILPSYARNDLHLKHFNGSRVEPGFCYNSHDNAEWLSEIELRTLITNHIDPNFKPN